MDQVVRQCVSFIELIVMETKEGIKKIKKRSINDNHIFISRYQESCHMSFSIHSSAVLSCSCSILFIHEINHLFRSQVLSPLSLKPSSTQSTSESELSASVASLASLKQITSAVTSVIMSMASAIKAAQDAAAASVDHPQASDDVVMLSADPILIVNSQDQASLESAEVRTELTMSGPTISGHAAPDSVICQMMSSTSHQVARLQATFLSSSGSWTRRRSATGSSSVIQSSSSISSIMCFRFLMSRIQLTSWIGSSIRVFKTRYIT